MKYTLIAILLLSGCVRTGDICKEARAQERAIDRCQSIRGCVVTMQELRDAEFYLSMCKRKP